MVRPVISRQNHTLEIETSVLNQNIPYQLAGLKSHQAQIAAEYLAVSPDPGLCLGDIKINGQALNLRTSVVDILANRVRNETQFSIQVLQARASSCSPIKPFHPMVRIKTFKCRAIKQEVQTDRPVECDAASSGNPCAA